MKTVIITGGNNGIGLGIAELFYENDYYVIVGGRKDYGLQNRFSKNFSFKSLDLQYESSHQELAEFAFRETGKVNCYINNVGLSAWRPIDKIDDKFLDNMINTNLKSAFWGAKASIKYMKENDTIINISSIAGKRGSSNNSAYVATKFGMNGLTQSLAKELGPRGIRVNAVCPVLIDTEGLSNALENKYSPAHGNKIDFFNSFVKNNSALERLPTKREVASMCLFLASDSSSAITGQCINVDCGVFPQ